MSMYSYPAGAIINGVLTTERTVRGPAPVTINDVSYPDAIFASWSPQELAALGIKLFIENPIPQDYIGGVPEDIETDGQITRTYPHMRLDNSAALRREELALYAELSQLDGAMPRAVEDLCRATPELWDALPMVNKNRILRKEELRAQLAVVRQQLADLALMV